MAESSRRNFLIYAGSGAATAVVASAMAPAALAAVGDRMHLPANAPQALVAYISDVRRGEVALLVDEREIVITDHDLVARLARAAAR
jgi:hypothetical protein